jgi:hypothetical protein
MFEIIENVFLHVSIALFKTWYPTGFILLLWWKYESIIDDWTNLQDFTLCRLEYDFLHIFFVLSRVKNVNQSNNSWYMFLFNCVLFYLSPMVKITNSWIRFVFREIQLNNWDIEQIDSQIHQFWLEIHEFVIFAIGERANEIQRTDNIYCELLLWFTLFTRLRSKKTWRKSYVNVHKVKCCRVFQPTIDVLPSCFSMRTTMMKICQFEVRILRVLSILMKSQIWLHCSNVCWIDWSISRWCWWRRWYTSSCDWMVRINDREDHSWESSAVPNWWSRRSDWLGSCNLN